MRYGILKRIVAPLLIAGALAVVVLKYQTLVALREQNQALNRKLVELWRLEEDNQRLYGLVAELRPAPPNQLLDELARLRGEAGRLRAQKEEWEKLCAENRQLRTELGDGVRPLINRDGWTYVGYADPESAFQSTFWAWSSGDPAMVVASMTSAARAGWANLSDEEVSARLARTWRLSSGFQILGQKEVSEDEVEIIANVYPDRDNANAIITFKRFGSEWKQDLDLYPVASAQGEKSGN